MTSPGSFAGFSRDREELEQHRAKVFDALTRHSDPIMREMGRQLANGTLAPRELLREPRYVDVLQRGLDRIADLDDRQLRARVFGPPGSGDPDTGEGNVPARRR